MGGLSGLSGLRGLSGLTARPIISTAFDFATGSGVAYSLRRSGGYSGFLFRIANAGGSTQDCNSVAEAVTFIGSGSGFVTIMYSQNGNGVNATNSTANRSILISSGTLVTNNGKAAIAQTNVIAGGDVEAFFSLTRQTAVTNILMVLRRDNTAATGFAGLILADSVSPSFIPHSNMVQGWFHPEFALASVATGILRVNGTTSATTGVARQVNVTTVVNLAMNGTAFFNTIARDRVIDPERKMVGFWQELISFNSVPTAARLTEIESNQTGFYL